MTWQSEVAPLRRVLLKHARDAFVSAERVEEQWRARGYLQAPDYDEACREYDEFAHLLQELGVDLEWMAAEDVGIDSIYVRDPSVVCDAGAIVCRMGKDARADEPEGQRRCFEELGIRVAGCVSEGGTVEGGDVVWLGPESLAVGQGYRTNDAGIDQLEALLPAGTAVTRVPLPHWRGPEDVFHLMSVLSPLAEDLLLVYSRLLPARFRESLLERGFGLVEVPDAEFDSLGCNVLAVAPRMVVATTGNAETRRRIEAAGVEVHTYTGREISEKGCGGPTCLSRPLEREG